MSKITLFYNPAEPPTEIPFDTEFFLGDYIKEVLPPADYECWVNDSPVNPDHLVLPGDDVVIRLRPHEVATIVAIASALLTVGSYLYFRSKIGKVDEFKTADSITGTRNRAAPNARIPVLLGRRRVYPNLASKPFSELVGEKQFYRQLFCFGYGPMKLEEFRIGDTLLTNFTDGEGNPLYEIQVQDYFENTPGQLTLYPENVDEQRVDIQLEQENQFTLRSVGTNTQELAADFLYPSGLVRFSGDGSRRHMDSLIQLEYRPSTTVTYYTIVKGNLIAKTAPGIKDIRGTGGLFRSDVARGEIVQVDNGDLYAIQIPPNQGLAGRFVKVTSSEVSTDPARGFFLNPTTMIYDADKDVTLIPNPDEKFIRTFREIRDTQRGFHVGLEWNPRPDVFGVDGAAATWDVRARNCAFDDNSNITQQISWTVLRGFKRSRPVLRGGFVLVALRIQASDQLNGSVDQFNAIATSVVPTWTQNNWDDSRATSSFGSGALERLQDNVDSRMTRAEWLSKTLVTSQNPAELMRWIIQGPFNKRPVPDSRIDLVAFNEFRDWCNTNNFKCNFVVEEESTVLQVLNQIAFTGRARFLFNDGLFSVSIDKEKSTPVQLYSDYNTTSVTAERLFLEKIDGIRARYDNEKDNLFQSDEVIEYAADPEGQGRFETIDLAGITDTPTAYRFARYRLAERELRRETYRIGSTLEKIRCKAGDRIRLQNKLLLIGQTAGRVVSIESPLNLVIEVNEELTFETGKNYGVQFRLDNFDVVGRTAFPVPSGTEVTHTLQINTPVSGLKVGDLFVFGEQGNEALDLIVDTIRPSGNGNADIICRNYAPELFTIDSGAIPAFDTGITRPVEDRVIPAPTIDYILPDAQLTRSERGQKFFTNRLGFSVPTSTAVDRAEAQLEVYDGTGKLAQLFSVPITERTILVPNLTFDTYLFRLRLARQTNFSPWVEKEITIFPAKLPAESAVPNVDGLELYGDLANDNEFGGREVNFRWNRVSNLETSEFGNENFGGDEGEEDNFFSEYLVEVFTNDGVKVREEKVTANDFSYTFDKNVADGGPRREFEVRVSVIGTEGQLSPRPASLRVFNDPPVLPSQVEVFPNFSGVEIFFNRPSDLDFTGARVYLSPTTPVPINDSTLEYDGPDTTPIKITGLEQDTVYYFRIQLYDAFGDGALSGEFTTQTLFVPGFDDQPPTVPGNPTILSTVRESRLFTTAEATVSWAASTDNSGQLFYRLEFWTNPSKVTVVETPLTSYNIVPIEANKEHFFRVKAIDYSGNESAFSSTVSHTVTGDLVAPAAVNGLSATGGLDKIVLSWTNPADSDFLYTEVYRSSVSSAIELIPANLQTALASEPGSVSRFVDANITNNTNYWYIVRAVDVSGNAGAGVLVGPVQAFKMDFANIDDYVEPSAIGGNLVATETIQAVNIAPQAITEVKLDAAAVTAPKIATSAVTELKIATDAVTSTKIAADAVTEAKIAIAAITEGKIASDAVTAAKIAAAAVTAVKIATAAITEVKIDTAAVTAAKIAALAVTEAKIDTSAVTSAKIAAAAITETKIDINAVTAAKIAAAAVTETKIADDAISTPKLQVGSVQAGQIAAGAVIAGKVAADAIAANNIQANAVVAGKIAANAVTAATIAAGSVVAGKIAVDAVLATNLAANSVVAGKIAADAVTAVTIAADAVTAGKVAANAISANNIQANAIVAGKIAVDAVTAATIAAGSIVAGKIAVGAVQAGNIQADAVTAVKIQAGAVVAGKIAADAVTATTIAAGAVVAGKIAADAVVADSIAANSVTAIKVAANAITAAKIEAGAVVAGKIAADAVTAVTIQAGAIVAGKIATNAVVADSIAANSITAAKVEAGAIVAGKIAANAVQTVNLAANSVVAGKVAADAITSNEIQANAIDAKHTITGAVIRTSAANPRVQLDSTNGISLFNTAGSVTTRLRIDGSGYVGLIGISPAITWDTAGTVSIPGTLVASGIDAANITVGFLNAGRIAAATITADKLNVTQLSAITADLGSVTAGTVTGALIQTSAAASTGIKFSNSALTGFGGGIATFHFDTLGSGFIGTGGTNSLSWNGSGVLTLSGTFSGSEIIAPIIRTAASGWRAELGPNVGGSLIRVTNGTLTSFSVDTSGNATFSGAVSASAITGSTITGTTITGNTISGGTVTGSIVRTASSGERVELSDSVAALRYFSSGGANLAQFGSQTVSLPGPGKVLVMKPVVFLSGTTDSAVTESGHIGLAGRSRTNYGVVGQSVSDTGVFADGGPLGLYAIGLDGADIIGTNLGARLRGGDYSVRLSSGLVGGTHFSNAGGHIQFDVNQTGSAGTFGRPTWTAPEGTLVCRREVSGGSARLWLQVAAGSGSTWVGMSTF